MKLSFPAVRAALRTSSPFLTWNIPDSQKARCYGWACLLQSSKSKSHIHVRIQEFPSSTWWHEQMVCHVPLQEPHNTFVSPSNRNKYASIPECFLCSTANSLATDSISFLLWLPGSSKPCHKLYHTNHPSLDFWDNDLPSHSQRFLAFYGLVSGGRKKAV